MDPATLGTIGSLIIKALFPVIDTIIKSKQEREKLKSEIIKTITKAEVSVETELTKRLSIDKDGSWLTRNIRPLILVYLSVICTVLMFTDGNLFGMVIKEAYVTMILSAWKLGIGFYFGSRGVEKAVSAINSIKKKK